MVNGKTGKKKQQEGVSPRIHRQIEDTHVLSKAASQPYYSGKMQPCSWLGKAKGWNAQDMGFALPRKGRRACELAGTVSGGGWDPAKAVQAAALPFPAIYGTRASDFRMDGQDVLDLDPVNPVHPYK